MATSRWQLAAAVLALAGGCDQPSSDPSAGPDTRPSSRGAALAEVWFGDLRDPIAVGEDDAQSLLRHVVGRLRGAEPAPELPAALKADTGPRIVFVSVSDGGGRARVAVGSGLGVAQAVGEAIAHLRGRPAAAPKPKWVKLDVVQAAHPLKEADLGRPLKLEGGLYGLAWSRNSGVALLAEELTAYDLVDRSGKLRPEEIRAYLRDGRGANWAAWLVASKDNKAWQFSTLSLFTDGEEFLRLYRGHRTVPRVTRTELLSAAKMGGQYLVRATREDGSFVYAYRASTGQESASYNIVRHCGTTYGMLELYGMTREKPVLAAAERAIGYMLKCVRPGLEDKENTACIVEGGYARLGGNALAAMALAKYTQVTGSRKHVPVMLKLAGWMQAGQKEGGDFLIHKQTYPSGLVSEFVSVYYPGEAMLALLRVHAIDPTGPWLDAAERAAHHLIHVRDRDEPIADQWQLYALNELYRLRRKEMYLRRAMRIARLIVTTQRRRHRYPDWVGSFLDPPRSTPTAVRMEGLCAAYRLARDFDRPAEAEKILEALRLGTAFQLRTQIRPELAMYMKQPQRAVGGVRGSLTSYTVRIDYVQHTISSLLGLYRILGPGVAKGAG